MVKEYTLINESNDNLGMLHNMLNVLRFYRTVSLTNADRALFTQTYIGVMASVLTVCGKSRC